MRIFCIVIMMLAMISPTLAVELHHKGETYTFKEEMQCFSAKEAQQMLRDLRELDASKQKVIALEKVIEDYKKQADSFRDSIAMHERANAEYKESIQAMRDSLQEYRNAASIYKDVIGVQTKALETQTQQANQNKRMRRWEKNLTFVAGFLAPVLGAWGLDRVERLGR